MRRETFDSRRTLAFSARTLDCSCPGQNSVARKLRMPANILFGRDKELATVDELVGGLPERGSALLIQGPPGIGKSSLLAHAVTQAQNSGFTVLKASGAQAETHLPFAGLHLLTRTMMERVSHLPPAQADALRGAFGMADPSPSGSAPQFFMIALATLSLLGDATAEAPVLHLGLLLALREGHTASLGNLDIRELHLKPPGADRGRCSAGRPRTRSRPRRTSPCGGDGCRQPFGADRAPDHPRR